METLGRRLCRASGLVAGAIGSVVFCLGVFVAPALATDQLDGVPIITFDDVASLEGLTGDHADLMRLYWAYFDREPDAQGALYWIDQLDTCAPLEYISEAFAASAEFDLTYGELDTADFLQLVYRNVLDRDADDVGLPYWTTKIESGEISRTDALIYFAASSEFRRSHPLPSDEAPGVPCRSGGEGAQQRSGVLSGFEVFATVGDVALVTPSPATEIVGYHQAYHRGAQPLDAHAGNVAAMTLSSRFRGTDRASAADIVVHPRFAITAPVTGTVVRAGDYRVYCQTPDQYVVIRPDVNESLEVKVLHLEGVVVAAGDEVFAGVTTIAANARLLPFTSQIDRYSSDPSWAHVHLEVLFPDPDKDSPSIC